MSKMPKTKKRGIESEDDSSKRKKRKSARQEENDLIDLEMSINKAISFMDSQLLSDHFAQRTSRFGSDLSAIELSDLVISGMESIPTSLLCLGR